MLLFHTRSLAVWAIAAICFCAPLRAQDPFSQGFGAGPDTDPDAGIFGGAPDFGGAPQPAANTAAPSSSVKESNPLVLSVRENPPKSPAEVGRAMVWMAGIQRFDELSRLMDVVKQSGWGTPQKAEIAKAIGIAKLLSIKSEAESLSDENKQLLSEIIAAPKKVAENPAWINKWMNQLASDDVGSQRLAYIRLLDSGDAAINALLKDLLSSAPKVRPEISSRCIAAFGEKGVTALRAACRINDKTTALRATLAVADMDAELFESELAAAIHGNSLSEIGRKTLLDLSLSPSVTDQELALSNLRNNFADALGTYQVARRHRGDLGTASRWMLSDDGQTVVAKELSPSERARAAAAHAAALLISVEPDAQKKLDCLAVMLQNGNAQVLTAEDTNHAGLLHSCERLQLHAAALDILKSISGGKVAPPLKHLELLGKYLNDSRPQFRYEAMTGIAAADPHFSYAGAEKSLHVALEMSQLRNGPSVLVIGHHSEITSAAKQQVESSLGGHAYTANTAREAIRLLNTDAPIEHILIADRVSDQSLFVLLQRFRGGRRTHDLPIAILTDELTDDESRLIGKLPGVVQSVLSRNESQIHRIASSLTEQLDTTPMNEADRVRYFEVGSSFLTEIISDRAKYGFYPVGDLRAKFQSLGIALSATARAELLRGLGTSDSQLRLIAMASDPELDDQDRVNAAQQFAVSAKRFGILIDRQSQLRIYDLYNQKGPNDPAAAESLGVILDAVEQR